MANRSFISSSTMPKTHHLLRREITYFSAAQNEHNILHQLSYHAQQTHFFTHLSNNRSAVQAIIAHHLNLASPSVCQVSESDEWLHGSFNVCIPVRINDKWDGGEGKRVLIRFPLPYRVGEGVRPGNADEKVRCEAGTYAWLGENCPDVPIARLFGFGLSTGEAFTRRENLGLFSRWSHSLHRRILPCAGKRSKPPRYVRHQPVSPIINAIGTGYLLLEFIEKPHGQRLANTWLENQHNPTLRENLFTSLARIYLSLTRTHLPRIGSFVIDNRGHLQLTNRPLTATMQQLENEGIPTDMSRDTTYSTTDSYILDILHYHDNRFRYQPNAVNDVRDAAFQLSTLTALRTTFPTFFRRELNRGPFVFSLNDLNAGNIFVDEEWRVTCLVDLEWACTKPIEIVQFPYWMTMKAVDRFGPGDYEPILQEFIAALEAEEQTQSHDQNQRPSSYGNDEEKLAPGPTVTPTHSLLSTIIRQSYDSGTFWYTTCLSSPSGAFTVFKKRLRHLFVQDSMLEVFQGVMPFLWGRNVGPVTSGKLRDKKVYDRRLREVFGVS